MQTVSADFITETTAPKRNLTSDVLVSWLKNYNASADFFTIGQSGIGDGDFIKGAGDDVTFFQLYDYELETDNLIAMSISKMIGQFPYGVMTAQADLILSNVSKRYLPEFDPDIGDSIKAGRPIALNIGFSSESIEQFIGFSDRPINTLVNRETSIHAYDAMEYLNNVESELGIITDTPWNEIIESLLDEQGFSSSQYNIEPSLQPNIQFLSTTGKKVGSIFRQGCEAEQYIIFVDEYGIIQGWNRGHIHVNSDSQWSFDYSNVKEISYIDTPIINHVRVLAKPRAEATAQVVWQSAIPIAVAPGEVRRYAIEFFDENGLLPIVSAETPSYNANDATLDSYYQTNLSEDGTGEAGNSNITMSDFDLLGETAFVEFTNSSTSNVVYITKLSIWGVPAKIRQVIDYEYKDQTSIDDNGRNPSIAGEILSIDNDYIQDQAVAEYIAQTMVEEYKDGSQQIKFEPFAIPQLQFGDVVSLEIEDTSETKAMVVVGNNYSFTGEGGLTHDVYSEERNLIDQFFTIGVSAIEGPDAISPL